MVETNSMPFRTKQEECPGFSTQGTLRGPNKPVNYCLFNEPREQKVYR
jgi:hypothetical protein